MKRIGAILVAVALLLTTLSGCDLAESYKRIKELQAAKSALQEMSESTAMDYSMDMTLHMEGSELNIEVTQESTISYSGMGSDSLCLDWRNSTTVKQDDADEITPAEQNLHFENNTAYVNTADMAYAKDAMTAEEFLKFSGMNNKDSSESVNIEEYGKQTYDNSSEKENILTLEDDSGHEFPWLLSAIGIAENCASATEYHAVETYIFDKEMTPKSMTMAITCTLAAFGESYTVKLDVKMDMYAFGDDVRVQELLGADKYQPTEDLAERMTCIKALEVTGRYTSCKVVENEKFEMTSAVPEVYRYTISRDVNQCLDDKDVAVTSRIQQTYDTPNQLQNAKYTIKLNKGVLSTTIGSETTKADYVNPFNYYAVIPSAFYPNATLTTDYIDSFRAEEKDGKLTCSCTLTTDMSIYYTAYYLSLFFGQEGAVSLLEYVKAEDIKERTCEMVIDSKTGGIISQSTTLRLEFTIESINYAINYTYSLAVSEAVATPVPEVGLPV